MPNQTQPGLTPLKGLTKYVYKAMGAAIAEHHMLDQNDRVMVAVSGGADSLSMLKLFQMRQRRIPIDFEVIVCFVDTDFIKVDRNVLEAHFKNCGVEYVIKELRIEKEEDRNCFWCSWNRRKILFDTVKEYKCNKLAFGHNLDDIVETLLMNMFYHGEFSTSPAILEMFGGEFKIIRPLCYLPKHRIGDFAATCGFPNTHYDCPYGAESKRKSIKETICGLEKQFPDIKKNLMRSIRNVKADYLL